MSTITKEWLESQISAIKAVGITDSNTLQAFEIALASLEAEPAIHRWRRVTFEPYGPYPWHYGNFIGFSKPVDGIEDEYYYAAPPAPVSVPAAMEMDDDFDSAFEHGKAVGWNAYRAAMLQSFGNSEQLNSPVIPDGWVLVPIEPTEDMIVNGFESEPDYSFSDEREWEAYDAMSGCQQAAHRAKLCWAAMIAASQKS
ncbi:hypothetical protein SPL90_08845 [Enterobacter hormaechei subsp. xiangfangensis]|uniref:hypothetical protein n=1 Tax=Enterobacter cloacae complex TaxID=354276 RepID=UPI00068B478B|nr:MULTISPECIES: hypothetical protein [Enterobacter cloacae complex]CAE6044205.1 hypothetical protein AH0328V1_3538 [Enterobacter cloacae]KVJ01565.1 hypothetical protein AWS41_14555 [Enterobacter hormaechei subsp. xiangfangensis]MCF2293688.1 hypothetical protein [Enterobacter hormaechei]MCI2679179.1 hypothetical protein [Enterobacter hormaechei]MCI2693428.1 hypothetical protein [Enterobacter hormaechei]